MCINGTCLKAGPLLEVLLLLLCAQHGYEVPAADPAVPVQVQLVKHLRPRHGTVHSTAAQSTYYKGGRSQTRGDEEGVSGTPSYACTIDAATLPSPHIDAAAAAAQSTLLTFPPDFAPADG